jgi:hypothetical protein
MLAAGDFDEFEVLLDYLLNQLVLLNQRTLAYFNHTGFWTTETTREAARAQKPRPQTHAP